MILANPASRYTQVPPSQTAVQIAGGETIRVHGILCSATNSGTVSVLDNSSNVIATINLTGNQPFELKTGFVAHKGLRITTPAATNVTVFHSQASA